MIPSARFCEDPKSLTIEVVGVFWVCRGRGLGFQEPHASLARKTHMFGFQQKGSGALLWQIAGIGAS